MPWVEGMLFPPAYLRDKPEDPNAPELIVMHDLPAPIVEAFESMLPPAGPDDDLPF